MPNTPPQPSILQAIKEGLDSVPLVTRYLVFGTLALSISSNLGIISAKQLILYPPLILEKYELWRLFTAHLLSTGSSMIWHVVFMYQYSKDLEENTYSNRKADYLFLILLSMLLLDVIGGFYGFMLLSGPFGMAIVTLFANSSPDKVVNFMFGFQFKAQFLPWILLAFGVAMGGDWESPIAGIATGYAMHYVDVIYPNQNNGRRLIPTPTFLVNLLPPPTGGTLGGAPPVTAQNSSRTTRTTWGTGGHRLGSE